MMEYRNPINNEDGTFDVEVYHQSLGWVPFRASPDDCEEHGRDIYNSIKSNWVESYG